MIKKIFNIVLLACLLIATTGFTVSKHYCGKQFVSFAVNDVAKGCCSEGNSCCHSESFFFQVDDDYSINSFYNKISIDSPFIHIIKAIKVEVIINDFAKFSIQKFPDKIPLRIPILFCRFLI